MLGFFSPGFQTATRTENRDLRSAKEPRPHSEAQALDIERKRKQREFGPRIWL